MATIYPFRGYRYDPNRVGDLSNVVTQPYDKISESLRLEYFRKHPANIVRVIKNENYLEAARYLNEWISEGILVRDADPALYAYEQRFEFEGETLSRVGLIGLISLDDEDLVVRGHETVLDKPLEDRLQLIRATQANEGLVFTLFSDPEMEVDRLLGDCVRGRRAAVEVKDEFGVLNRLWPISESAPLVQAKRALKGHPLYIADGHHRFMTSKLYHQECLENGVVPASVESFDKRMVAMFNMESEGVRILPTHRGVRVPQKVAPETLEEKLEAHFEVEPVSDLQELIALVEEGQHEIGLTFKEEDRLVFLLLKLKDEALASRDFMSGVEGASRRLDVNLLHRGILHDILGISAERVAQGDTVGYFREKEELRREVEAGHYELGFFLKATSLEQVRQISEEGVKMPQKSTDFFPKLLTGLVLMKMDIRGSDD